jgi:hypothetical protein
MRRTELIKMIRREAKRQGVSFSSTEGGEHSAILLGKVKIPVPRHAEIGYRTTQDILHECEQKLGKGWWR